MEAIDFVTKYPSYVETIKKVTKDEYLQILEEMGKWDPHDRVTPKINHFHKIPHHFPVR